MRRSKFYNMRLPERGAREGEANDAADIEDLTYDLGIIDAEMERQRLEDVRLEKDKATKLEMSQHKSAAVLDHPDGSVTDAKLGQRTVLTTSGPLQILLTAIGNAVKAISGASTWNGTPATTLKDAKTHMDDAVKHITAQEREGWNAAATDRHSHTNKSVLDGITAAMVTTWNTVSSKLPLAGGTLTGFLTLHAAPTANMHAATKKYVDDKMAASGSGDMLKSVYDTNEDGVVDKAETVPWSGVTGKPSTFPPSTHTHTKNQITDFPASLKNPNALTISLNGTSQGAYDGSAAKSINITAAGVGALPSEGTAADANKLGGHSPQWWMPTGMVVPYAGAAAPDGWLLCQGQAVSRTTYAQLFSVIGTTYGSGDGSTTFNLPDMRGRVAVGSDANWGCAAKRGETAHTQLLTEMAEHYHGFRNNDGQQVRAWVIDESSNDSLANGSGSKASVTWQTMNAGNSTPFNVMQPSLYLHHIIKI